jgi:hypothetical protein
MTTRLRVRATDVRIGDVLVGTTLHPTLIVRAVTDAGCITRERRKRSSQPNVIGDLISSVQVAVIRFDGRQEMCEFRTIAADQWVSIIRKAGA